MSAPVLELVSKTEESIGTSPLPMEREPSLDQLAAEIRQEHEAAERSIRASVRHARAAGVKLHEAKQRLGYSDHAPGTPSARAYAKRAPQRLASDR